MDDNSTVVWTKIWILRKTRGQITGQMEGQVPGDQGIKSEAFSFYILNFNRNIFKGKSRHFRTVTPKSLKSRSLHLDACSFKENTLLMWSTVVDFT